MSNDTYNSLLEATKAIKSGATPHLGADFIEDFYNRSCIYFLLTNISDKAQEVVYVGQTNSLGNRLGAHYKDSDKEFDSFSYIFINKPLLDEMEEIMISVFHPKFNDKGHNWYLKKLADHMQIKSVSHLKKCYGISSDQISFETVIGLLECKQGPGEWFAKKMISALDPS